jgi:hypothetical protein
LFLIFCLFTGSDLSSISYVVNDSGDTAVDSGGASSSSMSGDLRYVLNQVYADFYTGFVTEPFDVTFTVPEVTLQGILPMIVCPGTIDGGDSGVIINGNGYRGLFVNGNFSSESILLQNLTFQNCQARGATGGLAAEAGAAEWAPGAPFLSQEPMSS